MKYKCGGNSLTTPQSDQIFQVDLGIYRNEASLQKIGQMMGISKGSMNDHVTGACSAILKLRNQVIKWPNEEEGKASVEGFVNRVGLIYGMLNEEDYFTRNGDYAIKGLVIYDDSARITWIEMGWPGSVHHN